MSKAPMPDSARGDAPMPSSFDNDLDFWDEGRWSKLGRRLKEEPLIPFGLALTCWALYNAAKSVRKGDKTATNRYFRARVYAQGFTVLCVVVGSIYWKEDREKRKYYEGLLGERKAEEKRAAWIKELEARDREEQEERERRTQRRLALRSGKPDETSPGEESRSALDTTTFRALVRSNILGPAMQVWWSRP